MSHSDTSASADTSLRDIAAAAIADVDALDLQGDDRHVVLKFVLAARLGAADTRPPQAANVGGGGRVALPPAGGAATSARIEPGDVLGKIAAALKVERDVLELVYDVSDGEPQLVISAKKLPEGKANGTRYIAQLIAAARQAAGLEEWTASTTIRPTVQDFGKLDVNNFAAQVQQLDKDSVALLRGKGAQREIKITRPGFERTGQLILDLIGS